MSGSAARSIERLAAGRIHSSISDEPCPPITIAGAITAKNKTRDYFTDFNRVAVKWFCIDLFYQGEYTFYACNDEAFYKLHAELWYDLKGIPDYRDLQDRLLKSGG